MLVWGSVVLTVSHAVLRVEGLGSTVGVGGWAVKEGESVTSKIENLGSGFRVLIHNRYGGSEIRGKRNPCGHCDLNNQVPNTSSLLG